MSPPLTPEQRSLRARIAANARWAKDGERKANSERAQRGLLARFEREVDPDGTLPEAERVRRAENARQAHMQRLAFKSSKARARRLADQDGGGDADTIGADTVDRPRRPPTPGGARQPRSSRDTESGDRQDGGRADAA